MAGHDWPCLTMPDHGWPYTCQAMVECGWTHSHDWAWLYLVGLDWKTLQTDHSLLDLIGSLCASIDLAMQTLLTTGSLTIVGYG